jgi:predicted phage baseplate assembly protein
MPIRPPALDDRGYDDLVAELLARVPAHTPEWTNPRPGDPGRTMVELFAWLADTVLYRANLIPERQRLAFLRLLGAPMRPAQAARGLVALADPRPAEPVQLRSHAQLKGPVPFETRGEVTVLPVEGQAYHKRALDDDEREEMAGVVTALTELYGLTAEEVAVPYVTTALFAGGVADPRGFDVVQGSVDAALWIALLAPEDVTVQQAREALGSRQVLNVGVAPAVEVPESLTEQIGRTRGAVPVVWEVSNGSTEPGVPAYHTLDVLEDGTAGLTRRGVVRLVLPGADDIGAPSNDVAMDVDAGVGARPPRLDSPEEQARLVAWIRMRPTVAAQTLPLSWVGVNVVEADQRTTLSGRILGESDGTADQVMQLPATSIEPESLELQVEEPAGGYRAWHRTDDLNTAGRDDAAYELDSEAGTVRFGDGVRGRVPASGMRVRVERMRAGGGAAGNLPPGSITKATGTTLDGGPARLETLQPLPTEGGADAETLAQAEARIPQLFRHRNRAVTADDYRHLAAEAPGVRAGRVEVLPRFKPHQRRGDVPGVVSVMVLPHKELRQAPNPRPDRPFLERVHGHLDGLRPVATELYVIGCEYVALGLAASIHLADGAARDATVYAVREALRAFLWPLAPGGPAGDGWPLGRRVSDRELEVVIARVPGVAQVVGVNLFRRTDETWQVIPRGAEGEARLALEAWQLPELLSVVVLADGGAVPTELTGIPDPFASRTELPGEGGTGTGGGGTGTGGPGGFPGGPTGPGGPGTGTGTGGGGRRRRYVGVPVVPEVC